MAKTWGEWTLGFGTISVRRTQAGELKVRQGHQTITLSPEQARQVAVKMKKERKD